MWLVVGVSTSGKKEAKSAYRRPGAVQNRSFMFKESFPFTLALLVDFVDADLLVPRCDCQMIRGGREAEIRNTVLRRLVQGHVLGDVARGVGLTRRCGRAHAAGEEGHLGRRSRAPGVKGSKKEMSREKG